MFATIVVVHPAAFATSPAPGEAVRLLRTLTALVPLAIAGLVSDVTIAAPDHGGYDQIADEAGCGIVVGADQAQALAGALAGARRGCVFLLLAGFAPEAGFADEAADFVAGEPHGAVRLRAAPANLWQRLAPALAPSVGIIAGRDHLPLKHVGTLEQAINAGRPGRTLRARARRVL